VLDGTNLDSIKSFCMSSPVQTIHTVCPEYSCLLWYHRLVPCHFEEPVKDIAGENFDFYAVGPLLLIKVSKFLTQIYLDLLLICPSIWRVDASAVYYIPCGNQISLISVVSLSMASLVQPLLVDHQSLFLALYDRSKIQKRHSERVMRLAFF
jgi:hypothetical protein